MNKTIDEEAAALKVDAADLSRVERGLKSPPGRIVRELERRYGGTLSELLAEVDGERLTVLATQI